jgi:hypothetical protein
MQRDKSALDKRVQLGNIAEVNEYLMGKVLIKDISDKNYQQMKS